MREAHSTEYLVHMANDIAHFFGSNADRDAAVLGISNHMKSFWTARMRSKLIAGAQTSATAEALEDLPREALRLLQEHPEFKPMQHPEGGPEGGGDAG
jgi:formate dehydrogenase subunit delta